MPRAIWNGSISFGLVTIPVKLYNAVSRKSVRFNQIDTRSGSRIRQQKTSAVDGSVVPDDAIARGFEYSKGQYVLVTDDELASVMPKANRTVDIEAFVEMDEIEPMLFDSAYYAAPGEGFEKPYKLLVQALENDGRVAVARFVRSNKEYLAALRPVDGRLAVSTLVYADEVVSPDEIPEFEGLDDVHLTDAELAMATQLIESLVGPFDHSRFHDTYREELTALLAAKAAGEPVVLAALPAAEETNVVDLLSALEASVAAAKAARSGAEVDADQGASVTPAKRPAKRKKAPAKKKAAAKRTSAKKATERKAPAKRKSA